MGAPGDISASDWQNAAINSVTNWTTIRNSCGAADGMGLASSYKGTTVVGINMYVNPSGYLTCRDPFDNQGTGTGSSVFKMQAFGPNDGGVTGQNCSIYFSNQYVPGTKLPFSEVLGYRDQHNRKQLGRIRHMQRRVLP